MEAQPHGGERLAPQHSSDGCWGGAGGRQGGRRAARASAGRPGATVSESDVCPNSGERSSTVCSITTGSSSSSGAGGVSSSGSARTCGGGSPDPSLA